MKNINETVKSKYLIYILFLAGGLLLGWLLFHNSDTDSPADKSPNITTSSFIRTLWFHRLSMYSFIASTLSNPRLSIL